MPRRDSSTPSSAESTNEQPLSDDTIEKTLRGCVATAFKTEDDLHGLTVRRIRTEVEEILHLEGGSLKADPEWKSRSDFIIKDEVVCMNE